MLTVDEFDIILNPSWSDRSSPSDHFGYQNSINSFGLSFLLKVTSPKRKGQRKFIRC